MSIISAVRAYMATCPGLETGALFVDHMEPSPINYAIIPVPGQRIVEKYLDGGSLREFPFLFQTQKSTADDLERIESIEFQETLADWFETQTAAGTLPTLAAGKTPESIEVLTWGYLFEEGQSDTGIYQITCKMTYTQP
jgi:hypothetical protein